MPTVPLRSPVQSTRRPAKLGETMPNRGVTQFHQAVEQMPALLVELTTAAKRRVSEHPSVPNAPGIYLFSDDDAPLYVGQTRKLRTRLQQHTGATRGSNQASFAFLIAKREAAAAGLDIARYRAVLEADLAFIPHFDAARALVAGMDVQFVELADALTRTLFEVYASLALNTVEYNSFETH